MLTNFTSFIRFASLSTVNSQCVRRITTGHSGSKLSVLGDFEPRLPGSEARRIHLISSGG